MPSRYSYCLAPCCHSPSFKCGCQLNIAAALRIPTRSICTSSFRHFHVRGGKYLKTARVSCTVTNRFDATNAKKPNVKDYMTLSNVYRTGWILWGKGTRAVNNESPVHGSPRLVDSAPERNSKTSDRNEGTRQPEKAVVRMVFYLVQFTPVSLHNIN